MSRESLSHPLEEVLRSEDYTGLSLDQVKNKLSVYTKMLTQAVAGENQSMIEVLEAKINALNLEMTTLEMKKANDPTEMNVMEAGDLNNKRLMN